MNILNSISSDTNKENERDKALRIIKAQNEMLEQAKESVIEHYGTDQSDVVKQIDNAISENLALAQARYNSSEEELKEIEYKEVNQKYKEEYEKLQQKKIQQAKSTSELKTNNAKKNKKQKNVETYDTNFKNDIKIVPYNLDDIPDYVQFDIIPLPSKGMCYPIDSPLRSGTLPVSYLTAADENLIFSPNMYRNGQIIDVILSRKILPKEIKPDMLCKGDRDAIIVWLRATGYGDEFPIIVRNPNKTDTVYNTEIKLSSLKYLDFELQGDENGYFDFITSNGDVLKFKIFTNKDEKDIKESVTKQILSDSKYHLYNSISDAKYYLDDINNHTNEIDSDIKDKMDSIYEWANNLEESYDEDTIAANIITEEMILRTVSVNGKTDTNYIKNYIENLRTKDAYEYRKYISKNTPGVDFKITIEIPESDGGGSFDTFLRIDDYIFRNIAE